MGNLGRGSAHARRSSKPENAEQNGPEHRPQASGKDTEGRSQRQVGGIRHKGETWDKIWDPQGPSCSACRTRNQVLPESTFCPSWAHDQRNVPASLVVGSSLTTQTKKWNASGSARPHSRPGPKASSIQSSIPSPSCQRGADQHSDGRTSREEETGSPNQVRNT